MLCLCYQLVVQHKIVRTHNYMFLSYDCKDR